MATTTIARIVHSFTNSFFREPTCWAECACGHSAEVGDVVECGRCSGYVTSLAKLKAALAGELPGVAINHTRRRRAGRVDIYRRDARSPTGVEAFMAIDETPEVSGILTKCGLSPLSPTERY